MMLVNVCHGKYIVITLLTAETLDDQEEDGQNSFLNFETSNESVLELAGKEDHCRNFQNTILKHSSL
jgi:hypothetical protein